MTQPFRPSLCLLAVTQFYHFAFLMVSLTLLGFGASGTLLRNSWRLQRMPVDRLLASVGMLSMSHFHPAAVHLN